MCKVWASEVGVVTCGDKGALTTSSTRGDKQALAVCHPHLASHLYLSWSLYLISDLYLTSPHL